MHNLFFHWDEAYTHPKLAILSEIGRSYRTTANNEENSNANSPGDHYRKRNQAIGIGQCAVAQTVAHARALQPCQSETVSRYQHVSTGRTSATV
jgi:hypothetical protein